MLKHRRIRLQNELPAEHRCLLLGHNSHSPPSYHLDDWSRCLVIRVVFRCLSGLTRTLLYQLIRPPLAGIPTDSVLACAVPKTTAVLHLLRGAASSSLPVTNPGTAVLVELPIHGSTLLRILLNLTEPPPDADNVGLLEAFLYPRIRETTRKFL